ncbi:hypothetical protein CISG_06489 [Coccidioides immitis RMSCC 3703]|uniref:Uncharacterized protein n=2 Tax=Coccidioides immitis TaxID=5501 RepID=A0A0J8TUI9_COCIT|nr:hypothetical protein CIRG_04401 [Coccidioides immitis RMSCC 2394]KMU77487.1 hypothetical protein CISG_06489 [Coccidioides immitis RMSCC 3703]
MYLPYPEPLREDAGFVQASRDSIFLETLSFEMKVQYNRVDWFPPHCASNLHSVQLVSDREARKPLLWSRSPQLHGPSMGSAWVNSTIAQQSWKNLVDANCCTSKCTLRRLGARMVMATCLTVLVLEPREFFSLKCVCSPQANQVDGCASCASFIVVVWTAPSMRLNGPDLPSVHEYVPIHDSQGPRLVSMKQTCLRS